MLTSRVAHVAGLLAYSISRVGNGSPLQAMDYLHGLGVDGILGGIREYFGFPSLLLGSDSSDRGWG
jgi:hypothetical protein